MRLRDWISKLQENNPWTIATIATVKNQSYKSVAAVAVADNKTLGNSRDLTSDYISKRLSELGLTKGDIFGENNPELKLELDEIEGIYNNKELFDIWIQHVWRFKQMKKLKFISQK